MEASLLTPDLQLRFDRFSLKSNEYAGPTRTVIADERNVSELARSARYLSMILGNALVHYFYRYMMEQACDVMQ